MVRQQVILCLTNDFPLTVKPQEIYAEINTAIYGTRLNGGKKNRIKEKEGIVMGRCGSYGTCFVAVRSPSI